ncbi:hypothetical protein BCU70_18555 [Vibrio sp. 10N.286.49.C2]|uniref:DUF2913 family protein n=1 Tax=unclassified Vibrio TaxID=2614977 RepID=UPI000CC2E045|nr:MULTISPECIES: DUF2913 family protein [unclassified Vibrio]PMH35151.1 hypothetical protein BCU70_18555 [Vibrio sp. 10N.286.49.C2]PMH57095.1 hypothetical protein BCU66_06255 [Vibrio sp. 10N.286.49.B1]PMH77900.1 hypothetical protein BCU58_01190 [Vibrio sp. 10N.286.48.B7]
MQNNGISSKQISTSSSESIQLLTEVSLHALLHLEFKKLEAKTTHFDREKCNELLVRWLKPKLKSNKYKAVRKQLKTMSLQAKKSQVDLEEVLLTGIEAKPDAIQPHLDSYLLLIREIEKKIGTTALLSSPRQVDLTHDEDGCLLCVLSDDLNGHFGTKNQLVSNISILFRGTVREKHLFLGAIYANDVFAYQIQYEDEHFVRITLELNK